MSPEGSVTPRFYCTRKMAPICLIASSFPKSMSNNKHEQIQNKYAIIALPHLSEKNIDFCKCAGITHCLTAKVSNSHLKKSFRGLLHVNQKRNFLEVCVVCQPLNSSG